MGMVNYFSNSLSAGSGGGHLEFSLTGQHVTHVSKIVALSDKSTDVYEAF